MRVVVERYVYDATSRRWLPPAPSDRSSVMVASRCEQLLEANRVLAVVRVPVKGGFAHLENWRILTKLRTHHACATHPFRGLLILTNSEATTDS